MAREMCVYLQFMCCISYRQTEIAKHKYVTEYGREPFNVVGQGHCTNWSIELGQSLWPIKQFYKTQMTKSSLTVLVIEKKSTDTSLATRSYVNVATILERSRPDCEQIEVNEAVAVFWMKGTITCTFVNQFYWVIAFKFRVYVVHEEQ